MGNFGKWLKKKSPELHQEMSTLDRANMKTDKAFSNVTASKYKTVGGLAEILEGEIKRIMQKRQTEDPSQDQGMLIKALKMAIQNIETEHAASAEVTPEAEM